MTTIFLLASLLFAVPPTGPASSPTTSTTPAAMKLTLLDQSAPPPPATPLPDEAAPAPVETTGGETTVPWILRYRDWLTAPAAMRGSAVGLQIPIPSRRDLASRGITLNVGQVTDVSRIGVASESSGHSTRGYAEVSATLDFGRVTHRDGDQVFVQFYGKHGMAASALAGDIQGTSNIDAEDFARLGEFWYETWVVPDRLRLKIGRVDAATEFAHSEHGSVFLAAPMGASPTIVGFPTYPAPTLSANMFWQPNAIVYASAGVYDGRAATPDDLGLPLFMVGEGGLRWGGRPGRVAVGVWHHTSRTLQLDPAGDHASTGPYLVIDQSLWRARPDDEESPGICVFLQSSTANADVSLVTRHLGAGVVWTGPFASRASDAVGFGLTRATLSEHAPDGAVGRETSVGPFYRLQITDAIGLQPNLQYVRNPGGTRPGQGAIVWTLRVESRF